MLERVNGVFPTIFSQKIDEEINEVLLCSCGDKETSDSILPSLNQAAKNLQSALNSNRIEPNRRPHIDIAELLKNLKVA